MMLRHRSQKVTPYAAALGFGVPAGWLPDLLQHVPARSLQKLHSGPDEQGRIIRRSADTLDCRFDSPPANVTIETGEHGRCQVAFVVEFPTEPAEGALRGDEDPVPSTLATQCF
jgi:hypothetical protein